MKVSNNNSILNQTIAQQDNLFKKLATARRINSAADDAAGLQIANQLTSNINAREQATRNVYDGVSLARVYDQGLQAIEENLQDLNTLAIQAGNGIYGASERQALQQQANQLLDNIRQTIDNTEFAGKGLFNQSGDVTFGTGDSSLSLATDDVSALLSSSDLFDFDLTNPAQLGTALGNVQQSLQQLGGLRADTGATINAFEAAASVIDRQRIGESEARSRIEDLDYAKAVSDQVAGNILLQSSISVAAQGRVQQEQALRILGG
ncbi:flagellin [Alkalimonas amylolytica]|uniref:Flagellin n=1 Tax=Alkalimonas amylolytica TaxID=152573 RepID=A0A1H4B751_ALKAM|nr:flagellin [Alkalimonas amylolytica]SEA43949.1 flagellin [Alkalimonas amylolytica]